MNCFHICVNPCSSVVPDFSFRGALRLAVVNSPTGQGCRYDVVVMSDSFDDFDPPRRRRRRRRRRVLASVAVAPALMTLGNLLCGFTAVFYASRSNDIEVLGHFRPISVAAALIFGGMLFDALDGGVARLTRSTSDFGAQLDSMADMVTFGVAPAFIVIQLMGIGTPFFAEDRFDTYFDRAVLVIGAIYAACCGLRLARFNVEDETDDEHHLFFKGLPSPGAAGTIASLVLLYQMFRLYDFTLLARINGFLIAAATLVTALAMISNLRYVHVVNRYLRGRGTFSYVALLVIGLILVLVMPIVAAAVGFAVYAVSAPAAWAYTKIGALPSRHRKPTLTD